MLYQLLNLGACWNYGFHVYPEPPGKAEWYWLTDYGCVCHFHGWPCPEPSGVLMILSVDWFRMCMPYSWMTLVHNILIVLQTPSRCSSYRYIDNDNIRVNGHANSISWWPLMLYQLHSYSWFYHPGPIVAADVVSPTELILGCTTFSKGWYPHHL